MKQIIVFIVFALTLGACSRKEGDPKLSNNASYLNVNFDSFICPTEGLCEFRVLENSSIKLNSSSRYPTAEIIKGHKLVFQYQYTFDDDANVMDDDYVEIIMFEIDPSQTNFEYKDENLKYIKAAGAKLCYCDDAGYNPLKKGLIKGKKLEDNTWDISIYVRHNMYENESKMISSIFKN